MFVGGASASIGSTDLGDAALDELASRAVAMARLAPADKFAGLAPEDMLFRGPVPDLDLDDATERSPQDLRRLAEEAEDAARAIAGVTKVVESDQKDGKVGFEVESEQGRDVRRDLARTIVGQGWGLLELRPMRMSLEEIFLSDRKSTRLNSSHRT